MNKPARTLMAAAAAVVITAAAASAHHGWRWAEEEQSELTGTVVSLVVAPPHPSLEVEAEDGMWKIELGNPRQTQRAGFDDTSASKGDKVVILGNRSLDRNEKRMKAVRITVEGKAYDIYPERIEAD
jgi:hypothetical protein